MWPGPSDQIVIVGSNGSGKTVFGGYVLSTMDWDRKPWVIFDYKRDRLLEQLPTTEIRVTDKPPTKPGLYIIHPMPDTDDEAINVFLGRCWVQENIGLYWDEGYMIPFQSAQFRAILTQGRSKGITRIILSQRPVKLDRFAFSEGTYFAIFRLTDKRDVKTVKEMVPARIDERLDKFHCYFYGVREDKLIELQPVPSEDEIVARFNARKGTNRKVL